MPRRVIRRRRPARKPRRKVRKGGKGKMSLNTKTDLYATYRLTGQIQAQTAITVAGSYFWYGWSPQHFNWTNVTSSSEFLVQCRLYDEFKVSSMKVTFRPYASQVLPDNVSPNYSFTSYTIVDRDGNVPVTTAMAVPPKLLSYDSCKVGRTYKAWSRTVRVNNNWTSTTNPTQNPQGANGLAQPWVNRGACQVIGFYAERLPYANNANIGEVIVEFKVQYRGKKSTALGYDAASGSVILTPLSSYPTLICNNPPLPINEVQGDESLQLNGDTGEIEVRSNGFLSSIAHLSYISSISYSGNVAYPS